MTWLRTHISILLMVVLVLTGHSMAIARGMPGASGYIELCTGTGPVMTPVDATGNPTGPSHICPEFSLSLMDAVAPTSSLALPLEEQGRKISEVFSTSVRVTWPVSASARSPPAVL